MNHSNQRHVKLTLVVLFAFIGAAVLGAQILEERTIPVPSPSDGIPVPNGLRWTTSIAEEGNSVWIVDSATNRIGHLLPDGALESKTLGNQGKTEPEKKNRALRQIRKEDGGGYTLLVVEEGPDGRLYNRLYRTEATLEQVSGPGDRLGKPLKLSDGLDKSYQVLDYEPFSGSTVALVDINLESISALEKFGGAPGWRVALVLIDSEGVVTPLIKNFESLLKDTDAITAGTVPQATIRDYSLDNAMRYLAVDVHSEKAYVLLLRSPARIVEVDLERHAWSLLESFPDEYRQFVSFSSAPTYKDFPSGAARLMAWLELKEQKRLPIGIFTDSQGALFVLGKSERKRDGRTDFDLVEVSSKTGRKVESYRLPLPPQTAHLLVASPRGSADSWGFLAQAQLREFAGNYSLKSFEFRSIPQSQLQP